MNCWASRRGVRELADRLRVGAEASELKAGLDHENIARECAALDAGLRLQWLAGGRSFDLIAVMRSHLNRLMSSIATDGKGL
ncbi:TetR family transcriptional regulator C-terminal domain-containing protein [Streptomyces sp. NPDC002853]